MKFLGFEITRPAPVNMAIPPTERKLGSFTIVKRAAPIVPADVETFINSYTSAVSQFLQSRIILYNQYQNALELDNHLRALIEHRLLATIGRKVQYVMPDGTVNQTVEQMTTAPVWEQFTRDVVMTRFWGQSLFEFDKDTLRGVDWFKYNLIPRKHIDPYRQIVTREEFGTEGEPWTGRPNVMYLGDPDDLGLLLPLTLLSIYKRNTINNWNQYAQRASVNFEVVRTRGQADPVKVQQIADRIANRGAGTIGLPEGVADIEIQSQASSQQNALFENQSGYYDDQQAKLVLGQTMTTEDGASRSQAEVHERTQDTIFDGDAKYFLNVLNYQFYEIQAMFGIPQGGTWQYADNNSAKAIRELEKDKMLRDLGYVFTAAQLEEKYGIVAPEQNAGI